MSIPINRRTLQYGQRVFFACAFVLLVIVLGACTPMSIEQAERRAPTPMAAPTSNATMTPRTSTPTHRPGTPTHRPGTPTITPVADMIRFTLDGAMQSEQSAMENVRLVLRSALLSNDGLNLTVAFENTSDTSFSVTGFVPAQDARLVDAWGQHYAPRNTTTDLQTISPPDGFAPGGAHLGVLRFPRPDGPPPYELLMPAYEPLRFELDQPEASTSAPDVPLGEYSLSTALRSTEKALAPVSLEVRSVTVATTTLAFDLSFVNLQRESYLVRGIDGADAWLLGGDGTQYRPITVTDSLAQSITPGDAWRPGGENRGQVIFPRPPVLEGARFIFASYETLVVSFAPDGAITAHVASSPITARTPIPTAANTETTFVDLTRLLDAEARALRTSDVDAYLSTFVASAHAEGRALLERLQPVPLASYELQIAPAATLETAGTGVLRDVEVDVHYSLRDVPGDSRFTGSLRYDFERDGTHWKIRAVAPGQTPPFWQTGDVVMHTSEHFLIFARPTLAQELTVFEQEAEAAYEALRDRGLTLEPRYVAYFAATTEDFRTLTGRSTGVVGVAFWQYEVNGDAFAVLSRAFYLNAAAFADRALDARRATITHELVHLALADQTRPFTPAWLKEGIAVYFEDQDVVAARRQLINSGMLEQFSLATLTPNGSLLDHAEQPDRIGYAYVYGGATIEYLVQRFGEAAVLDLYRSYTEIPADEVRTMMPAATAEGGRDGSALVDERSAARTDEVLVRFFGMNTVQLDAAVKEWLRTQS